jgi:uncharacterized protein (TIGR03437 family)
MKRSITLINLALVVCTVARAQSGCADGQQCVSVRIGTTFTSLSGGNPVFVVDGSNYTSPQNFVWPLQSKHIVQFLLSTDANNNVLAYQSVLSDTVRYFFGGWQSNSTVPLTAAGSPIQTITAGPDLTSLIANATVQYRVHLSLPNSPPVNGIATCAGAPANPGTGNQQGIVYFNGACYATSTDFTSDLFLGPGTYSLNAFPYPGWVFWGWSIGNNPVSNLSAVTIPGPLTIIAQFSVAKRVNFVTSPPGLSIIVDGTIVNTVTSLDGVSCQPDYTIIPPGAPTGFVPLCAGQFDFLPGSKHTIGATPAQIDKRGNNWVFRQFSTGAGQNSIYVAGTNTSSPDSVGVTFVPGHHVSILTNPGSMKVMIDGRDNWPGYSFIWGEGDTHHLAAESPQSGAKSRVYQFTGWSDGGDTGHDIVVGSSDMAVTASYSVLNQISIASSGAQISFTVDGSACTSPCVVNKSGGSSSQISAPASVPGGTGTRYDFVSWSDGNTSPTRSVSFSQDTMSLTATYQTSYQFTGVINPAKAGVFKVTPSSVDGFYAAGSPITVTVAANGGYKFAHWEGDLSGSLAPGSLTMSSPHSVQADFATVPFIPPAGVQSVTGPTPDGSVAPGSIVSIYGQNLAPGLQVGPNNPLSQALANVTVTIGDYLLPLVFVSPGQIGAQIPWELAEGTYTLVVHNTGLPDVPGQVTITRNAPGVFTQQNDQQLPLALALHADGTVVNFQSPAALGEQVTIYATGLGPYDHPAVDGFPAAGIDPYNLLDPIAVNTDTTSLKPDWAGAAPGMVGVAQIKLTITSDMPSSSNVNLIVQVNSKVSAQVVLPTQ